MLVSRELLAEDPRPCRRLVGAICRVLTQSACCDAYPRRCQHEPPLHAAFHRAEPGQDERGAAAGRPGRQRRPGRQAEERRPQHGGGAGRPPRRAGAHRQPQLPLLRSALALALQQDAARRFQGECGARGGRAPHRPCAAGRLSCRRQGPGSQGPGNEGDVPATLLREPSSRAKGAFGLVAHSARALRRSFSDAPTRMAFRRFALSTFGEPCRESLMRKRADGASLFPNPDPSNTALRAPGQRSPGTRARPPEVGCGGWRGPTLHCQHPSSCTASETLPAHTVNPWLLKFYTRQL